MLSDNVPVSGPSSQAIFEDLEDGWPDVVFCVEPWDGDVCVEGGFPFEAAVWEELHAEERHGETGEARVRGFSDDRCTVIWISYLLL